MRFVRVQSFLAWACVALLVFPPVPVLGATLGPDQTGGFLGACNGDGALSGTPGTPCTLNGAHKVMVPPAIDGSAADWAGHSNKITLDWIMDNGGTPIGSAIVADIRYAWDDDNLYILVEATDDDPTGPYSADDWCGDCDAGASGTGAAPWSADSVGFYDQFGQPDDPATAEINGYGPYTQFWAGFMSAASIAAAGGTAGSGDPHHMTRFTNAANGAVFGPGQLVGPGSVTHATATTQVSTTLQGPTTAVQSAFADDGTTRTIEMFMSWDQLRWDSANPTGDAGLAALLASLGTSQDGHYRADVTEGYDFRLDPILVDNDGTFGWGSQGGPAGGDPSGMSDVIEDQANIALLYKGDINNDNVVDSLDLGLLLAVFGTGGNSQFEGNLNGSGAAGGIGVVDSLDLGLLLAEFGLSGSPPLQASAVPEPSTALLVLAGLTGLLAVRRRKRSPRRRS